MPVGERELPGGRIEQEHLLFGGVAQPGLDQQPAFVDAGHAADLNPVRGDQFTVSGRAGSANQRR